MYRSFKHVLAVICSVMIGLTAAPAVAQTYTENFEAAFPSWETGWFGVNSNATNVYGMGAGRGNNPDGLWINDGLFNSLGVTVTFDSAFATSLTSFYMDIAGYQPTTLTFFDQFGATLFSSNVVLTQGAYTDPGVYARYGTASSSGIGGFSFSGQARGNTSIDNLEAIAGAVPEPSTWAMMLVGFGGVGFAMRRRRNHVTIVQPA